MSRALKLLIGLAAVMLTAWIYHGPLGQGEALIDRLEQQARTAVAQTELPAIDVRLSREPLARHAILSGPADDFQREGQGELPGINDIVGGVEGISGFHWADRGSEDRIMPLLLETLALALLAYLVGLGLGWVFFGRPKKQGYL